jgi:hypothetical protein
MTLDIDETTMEILLRRFKGVVSALSIIQWLNNFEKNEIKLAIDLLSKLTVYTSYEIEESLNTNFIKLYPKIENNEIVIIHPIGEFGKSGSLISYFVQKTNFFQKNRKKIILTSSINNSLLEAGKVYDIVLIDDFIGTGKTIIDYYNNSIKDFRGSVREIHLNCVAGIDFGVSKVKPLFDRVSVEKSHIFKKAFSGSSSYFGYRKFYDHRALSYKYGEKLSRKVRLKNGTLKSSHALGFNNSQGLVAFSYGSPNNSLPIFWANKDGWKPLIPRFSSDKMKVSKQIRKTLSYELSLLKEFSSEDLRHSFFTLQINHGKKTFTSVNKIDFSIYGIIKLSRSGYSKVSICQNLGISTNDFDDIIDTGKERGLFDKSGIISDYGLQVYNEARLCLRKKKREIKLELSTEFKIKAIDYRPKKFNGKS